MKKGFGYLSRSRMVVLLVLLLMTILTSAFAVGNAASTSATTAQEVTFRVQVQPEVMQGQQVYIAGNQPELGYYVPFAVPMKQVDKNVWEYTTRFEPGTKVTYEYSLDSWGQKGTDREESITRQLEVTAETTVVKDEVVTWEITSEEPDFPRIPSLTWRKNPQTTITITYGTDNNAPEKVYYGLNGKLDKFVTTDSGKEKSVTLEGLKPGKTYSYRIGEKGKVYHFTTAQNKQAAFRFVSFGDPQRGAEYEIQPKVAAAIVKEKPSFAVCTGDFVMSGWDVDDWKSYFFPYFTTMLPYYVLMATPGNHENESGLFHYYFPYPEPVKWYTFVYGNTRFISVDAFVSFAPGSKQYRFVEETLKNARETWKFVYVHTPPYSSGGAHGSNLELRDALCPLFEKYGVDVVLSGHNHFYERTKPITQNKVDAKKGVVYIVSGGSGGALADLRDESELATEEKAWSGIKVKANNYLLWNVDKKKLSVTVKTPDGKIIDTWQKVK